MGLIQSKEDSDDQEFDETVDESGLFDDQYEDDFDNFVSEPMRANEAQQIQVERKHSQFDEDIDQDEEEEALLLEDNYIENEDLDYEDKRKKSLQPSLLAVELDNDDDPEIYADDIDSGFEEYLRTNAFEFKQIEEDLYWMRRFGSSHYVVIAYEQSPLVHFCLRLASFENYEMDQLRRQRPAMLSEYEGSDADPRAPGIVAQFVSTVLYSDPQVVLEDTQGKLHLIGEERSTQKTKRPEGIEIPSDKVDMLTLDPVDSDYDVRFNVAQRIAAGSGDPAEWRAIEEKLKRDHLRTFAVRGNMGGFGNVAERGFTTMSPVKSEDEQWFVVNVHYYLLFKAYERLCHSNGNMLYDVNRKLHSADARTFVLGQPETRNSKPPPYTVQQEHAVLHELLKLDRRNDKLEQNVFEKYLTVRQISEEIGSLYSTVDRENLRSFENSARAHSKSVLPFAKTNFTDTLEILDIIQSKVDRIDQLMEEINVLRQQRSKEATQ